MKFSTSNEKIRNRSQVHTTTTGHLHSLNIKTLFPTKPVLRHRFQSTSDTHNYVCKLHYIIHINISRHEKIESPHSSRRDYLAVAIIPGMKSMVDVIVFGRGGPHSGCLDLRLRGP